jgi:eukaryotic-like serine/threonine-protein kinase
VLLPGKVAASSPNLPKIIGRYEVTRVLGQGAMGRVLLARDPVLNRDVAIKVLRDDLGIPPEVTEGLLVRMRHEAQAAARVTHPNLVTLHDMGEDDDVGLYLVFEFVSGQNLKERLRGGRLPPLQAARLARELGNALAVAHMAGVLHRDVKPENVMLAPTGAKIADFGIAKIPDSTLTRAGSLIGTPAYCAPEALASGAFSPESDQFSLAATLYEATSGERAFPGDDAVGVAAKIQLEEPRPIARRSGLPDEVDAILLRAMSKDPTQRFASTAELGETLAAALERAFAPSAARASNASGGGADAAPLGGAAAFRQPAEGRRRRGHDRARERSRRIWGIEGGPLLRRCAALRIGHRERLVGAVDAASTDGAAQASPGRDGPATGEHPSTRRGRSQRGTSSTASRRGGPTGGIDEPRARRSVSAPARRAVTASVQSRRSLPAALDGRPTKRTARGELRSNRP